MKIYLKLTIILMVFWHQSGHTTAQILPGTDGPGMRILREILSRILIPTSENPRNLRLAEDLSKLQPKINDDAPFPCLLNNTRSKNRPTSVHALRPGDIDVVAAIGDGMTAGAASLATNVFQVVILNRGVSFSIGGQGHWRQYLTLPNILKEFNPHLTGYSLKDVVLYDDKKADLNIAGLVSPSRESPSWAQELIQRINEDPRINHKTDWKMVTFFVGGYDFCVGICKETNPEGAVERHRQELREVLRVLRDNLPRTIVNVILTPSITHLAKATTQNRPLACSAVQSLACPCVFALEFQEQQERFNEIMTKWQKAQSEVVNESEFDRDDFAAVAQPFAIGIRAGKTKEGLTDYSFYSPDCFHPSQKLQAIAAISLWNNLLEPVGRKSTTMSEPYNFKCPTSDHPYIFTKRNSM